MEPPLRATMGIEVEASKKPIHGYVNEHRSTPGEGIELRAEAPKKWEQLTVGFFR
ncbi:MAG TPA: hypothetical protein VKT78_15315 [Fimbriimonadaceae bacterium]|nr:hypothetical protein [Fimbriimonadaceae bacterium]